MGLIAAGLVVGGVGAAVAANQASKDRSGARNVANMPGIDLGSAVGEAGQLAPRTRDLEAQRNAFNRAQLLESLGIQIPGYQQGQLQRTQNAMSLLRGELPPDLASQIQRSTASRALTGGYAGSQAARNLTARDLGRTSLDLQQAGAQQFSNIIGTTPLSPLANYELTPQMIANVRGEERAKKQAALLGTYNMPSAGGVTGQYLGSLGSGLTNAGFGQLGAGGGGGGGGGGGNWNYSTGMPTGYGREGLL
jgi:hypothetical protein